ncbi:MAG: flagellar export chaperone FliS [Desulfotomaculaceae bacterium]
MAMLNPYLEYQKTQNHAVLSADQGKLALMLYDGATKFTRRAIFSIDNKRIEDAHNYILKTQDIVHYLAGTLNRDNEISENLASIYGYISRRLMDANIGKDKDILQEVLNLTTELKDTWAEAYRATKKTR